MKRELTTVLSALGMMTGILNADIEHFVEVSQATLTEGDDAGTMVTVYDLMVTLTGGDDWSSTNAEFVVTNGTIYQHPEGLDIAPFPMQIMMNPDLEFDSYYTTTSGNVASFAIPVDGQDDLDGDPATTSALWFDTPMVFDTTALIARVTVIGENPSLSVVGDSTTFLGMGDLMTFEINVPGEGACEEDLDGNDAVGGGDLLILLNEWGCDRCVADFDGNGTTGGGDLLILLNAWGPCN